MQHALANILFVTDDPMTIDLATTLSYYFRKKKTLSCSRSPLFVFDKSVGGPLVRRVAHMDCGGLDRNDARLPEAS
jgi:hypothetical protein